MTAVDPELRFHKALLLADRGDHRGAEECLRDVLDADVSGQLRVRALVVLGDLLVEEDPVAARALLADALATAGQVDGADDLVGAELRRARELLGDG